MESAQQIAQQIIANVERAVIGKREAVELALLALICQGHVLIEDVPGVGKTVLAKSLARSIGCRFKRIQFTPDLLPGDVTGVSVYNQKTGEFEFRPGPILAQIVLVDEINRASPKTQSALLECMEERQVSVDGVTYPMPRPFMVLATQNPIEYEGTFPLPEAQLDRFLIRLKLGYPSAADEIAMLGRQQHAHPVDSLVQVATADQLLLLQEAAKAIHVSEFVKQYIVTIVDETRRHPDVYLGASPRGSLALYRLVQARALVHGNGYATPDDVKALAQPALAHRIVPNAAARLKGIGGPEIIAEVLDSIVVPGARVRGT